MLAEGQVKVGSLLMGPGTRFSVQSTFNPWSRSTRADMSGSRAWGHGSWSGVEWAEQATVPIPVMVLGASSNVAGWMTAQQSLAAAFAAVGTTGDVELRWCLGGSEYVMYGRPRMSEPDPVTIGVGFARSQCAMVCPDPLIYAGTPSTFGPLTTASYVGGLTFPVTFPVTFTSTLSGSDSATITNSGTVANGVTVRVTGPCTNPVLWAKLADTTVSSMTVSVVIPSGSYLDIDTKNRTVLLNGTTSARGAMTGTWPVFPPGVHTLTYRATASAGSSASGSFQSAWW